METIGLAFAPERLAQLVEALPVGVFILDRHGRAVYANGSAVRLLGRGIVPGAGAGNLAERYAAVLAGTDEPYPEARLPIVRALSGERTTCDDMEVLRDGERIALEVTASPIVDESGEIVAAVAVFQDITERRRMNDALEERVAQRTAELRAAMEAVERASKAKSAFLMNVSHELRTPLNHVIGFSELLADRLDDPRHRNLAMTAGASGRELLAKINDLIELARAESETIVHATMTFAFDELLSDVAAPLHVRCDFAQPVGMITASRDVVRQLLDDLLRRTSQATVGVDGGCVVVSIADAGLAERVRTLSYVFGETPPDDTRRFRQQQIDLRLAIARAQARAAGGELRARGNEVRLELPVGAR